MLKLWTFTWGYVGMYGARPNAICYICEEGVVDCFVSTPTYLSSNDCKIAFFTLP